MAVGGMLGGGDSSGGGAYGGARMGGIAAAVAAAGGGGGIGVVNRESLRDVVARGGGGSEDFASLYGRDRGGGGGGGGGGGSFVAYTARDHSDHHANISSSIPVLSGLHRDDDGGVDQGEIQVWHSRDLRDDESKEKAAMASQMRAMEISQAAVAAAAAAASQPRSGCELSDQLQHSKVDEKKSGGGGSGAGGTLAMAGMSSMNTANSNSTTCQDCGNQAKKDCIHMRCRTCCKSRGFDCITHVKSTWVPAAKRRERQQAEAAAIAAGHPRPKTKRSRFVSTSNAATTSHTSTSANTPPRSSDINSTQIPHQDLNFKGSLPAEIKAEAVFKCVRVTAIEDGEDEYAYQTTVKIGGHIFKGMLYDQRLDVSASMASNFPDLHLRGRNIASTSTMIDAGGGGGGGGIYGAPGNSGVLGDLGATSNEVMESLSTSQKKDFNNYKASQEPQHFYGNSGRFMDFENSRGESYKSHFERTTMEL